MPSVLSIFADESGEWGKRSEYYLITLVFHDQSKDISLALERYRQSLVVPEFLRTLVFVRPRGDDQFADCTFSPSLDMSR